MPRPCIRDTAIQEDRIVHPIEATQERRVRRLAVRHGLQLVKSRNRTPGTPVFRTYGVIDPWSNTWVYYSGGDCYGLTLADVAALLTA
jgi:hypothetical protein